MTLNASSTQEEKNAHYRKVLQTYADGVSAGDVDTVCGLFAEDGGMEDPVGGPWGVLQGAAAIRGLFEATAQAGVQTTRTGPISGSKANYAAMPYEVKVNGFTLQVIGLATFDEAGKITRYNVYWGPGDYDPPGRDPSEGFLD